MLAVLLVACAPQGSFRLTDEPDPTTFPATTEPTPDPTDPTLPTVPTDPTDTGTVVTLPFDCAALPATGTFLANLDYVPTFEDFTFSEDGYLWGISVDDAALSRTPYGGPAELLHPALSGYPRGTRFLPEGDLVFVDYPNNAMLRIDRDTYEVELLNGALSSPNGIAIGDDGFIYLSQGVGDVLRIDPVTGDATILVESPVSNDGITFSPDYRTLFINSDMTGDFLSLGVDAAGAVTSPLALFATLPGPSDGMVMDACGNAYVTQFFPPAIVRVRTDGTVEPFIVLPVGQTIVAANFGTGVGGWGKTHLFLSDLDDGMLEYDVGVYGKWEPHLPR